MNGERSVFVNRAPGSAGAAPLLSGKRRTARGTLFASAAPSSTSSYSASGVLTTAQASQHGEPQQSFGNASPSLSPSSSRPRARPNFGASNSGQQHHVRSSSSATLSTFTEAARPSDHADGGAAGLFPPSPSPPQQHSRRFGSNGARSADNEAWDARGQHSLSRKRSWTPANASPANGSLHHDSYGGGEADAYAGRGFGYGDDSEELRPAKKKRRSVASTLVDTALNATLMAGAAAITAYSLWSNWGRKDDAADDGTSQSPMGAAAQQALEPNGLENVQTDSQAPPKHDSRLESPMSLSRSSSSHSLPRPHRVFISARHRRPAFAPHRLSANRAQMREIALKRQAANEGSGSAPASPSMGPPPPHSGSAEPATQDEHAEEDDEDAMYARFESKMQRMIAEAQEALVSKADISDIVDDDEDCGVPASSSHSFSFASRLPRMSSAADMRQAAPESPASMSLSRKSSGIGSSDDSGIAGLGRWPAQGPADPHVQMPSLATAATDGFSFNFQPAAIAPASNMSRQARPSSFASPGTGGLFRAGSTASPLRRSGKGTASPRPAARGSLQSSSRAPH